MDKKKRVPQSNKKLLAFYLGEKSSFDKDDLIPKKVKCEISVPKPPPSPSSRPSPKTWQRTINAPKIIPKTD